MLATASIVVWRGSMETGENPEKTCIKKHITVPSMKLLIALSMCAVASAMVSGSSSALQKCQSQCRQVYSILNGDGTKLGNENSFDVSGCFLPVFLAFAMS